MDGTGVVGYGVYIPRRRIKMEEIVNTWHNTTIDVLHENYDVYERVVLGPDEDVITMAVESAKNALHAAEIDATELQAVYLGSCTAPYVSKASATVLCEAIGAGQEVRCADLQFAGKSGTACLDICASHVLAGKIKYGLAVGSDSLSSRVQPNDFLEYYFSSGAAALIIGKQSVIAEIEDSCSYTTDTTDYFRIDGDRYIRSGGRSMKDVGYNKHMIAVSNMLMTRLGYTAKDFSYAVFQHPGGLSPYGVIKGLGFSKAQIVTGDLHRQIGDCGAASPLIGLSAVLNQSNPGDRILLASYGFGAGSDAFSLVVTEEIEKRRIEGTQTERQLEEKIYVDYATYLKYERKYIREY